MTLEWENERKREGEDGQEENKGWIIQKEVEKKRGRGPEERGGGGGDIILMASQCTEFMVPWSAYSLVVPQDMITWKLWCMFSVCFCHQNIFSWMYIVISMNNGNLADMVHVQT